MDAGHRLQKNLLERTEAGEEIRILRKETFGKDGRFNLIQRAVSGLPSQERAETTQYLHEIRQALEILLAPTKIARPICALDVTLPPLLPYCGTLHPVTQMADRMVRIFMNLGFEVSDGPEIVSPEANFSWLNIPDKHPARDPHDTFYLSSTHLLRTQTTAVQVSEIRRRNEEGRLPIRIVVPGKTYRRESDASHSPMFHQFEGILVDSVTSMADLKGSLHYFVSQLFGNEVESRFRPHHFPFTEPSAELDIRWKGSDAPWLEMGGCGMIHPEVLMRAGLDPKQWRGWAFGMGIERSVMVDSGVSDLRLLFENDVRFLSQFPL